MPVRVSMFSSSARSRRKVAVSRSIGSSSGALGLGHRSTAQPIPRRERSSPEPTAVGIMTTRPSSTYGFTGSSLRLLGRLFKSGRVKGRAVTRRNMDAMAKGPRWWQGATLYQIYVRSWRDTDADGYGDLPGVIAGLDYLAWLGGDAICLSPPMPPPAH